jgi:hypothetical protein
VLVQPEREENSHFSHSARPHRRWLVLPLPILLPSHNLASRFAVVRSQRIELEVKHELSISHTRNRAVSNVRRWTQALRLAANSELIAGRAKTNSMAARGSRASRSSAGRIARYFSVDTEPVLSRHCTGFRKSSHCVGRVL